MPALQKFLQLELPRRGWTIETFARRVPMSTSRAYQIVNEGQDNVRQDMFARIAAALDMTPVDLHARTGNGMGDLDAHDLEWLDVGRLLSLDQRSTWARAVRAAANTSDGTTANPPGARSNNHRRGHTPPLANRQRGRLVAYASSLVSLFSRPFRPTWVPNAA